MSTVILSGTTLLEYVQQARNVCGPDFPIIGLNRQYHIEPSKIFNSLPHTEVDGCSFLRDILQHISTHYLTQRQTGGMENPLAVKSFQLTTSHRGRQAEKEIEDIHQNFNSLPHTEVDPHSRYPHRPVLIFQLTTSHRGRRIRLIRFNLRKHFNSLPHTEVD